MSTSTTAIFKQSDLNDLSSKGLVRSSGETGTLRLHVRRTTPSSDEENKDVPLDVQPGSTAERRSFITIPEGLVSYETLLFVGFTKEKATDIWSRWANWLEDGIVRRETDPDKDENFVMEFDEYFTAVFDVVNATDDTYSEDTSEWTRCMDRYGLNKETQESILDPDFDHIRLTESCAFWAKDTVLSLYQGLKEISLASLERDKHLRSANPGPQDRRSTTGLSASGPSTSNQPQTSQAPGAGLKQEDSLEVSLGGAEAATAIAARHAPGQTILYKGLAKYRVRRHLNTREILEHLTSSPRSDFSGRQEFVYLTPDFEVARRYAAYTRRRAIITDVVIVSIAIPNRQIESMQAPELLRIYWPDPEWKELVWRSRTHQRPTRTLSKYKEANLIIGTIAKKPSSAYDDLPSWEGVLWSHVFKKEGPDGTTPAIQFAFTDTDAAHDLLYEAVERGVKVFPFSRRDLDKWVEANRALFAHMESS